MATITKQFLSGSSYGNGILISTTGWTIIHTAPAGTSSIDEVWMYVNAQSIGNSTQARVFHIDYWSPTPSPTGTEISAFTMEEGFMYSSGAGGSVEMFVPHSTWLILIPGFIIQNGISIRAYLTSPAYPAGTIYGFVNRITN